MLCYKSLIARLRSASKVARSCNFSHAYMHAIAKGAHAFHTLVDVVQQLSTAANRDGQQKSKVPSPKSKIQVERYR